MYGENYLKLIEDLCGCKDTYVKIGKGRYSVLFYISDDGVEARSSYKGLVPLHWIEDQTKPTEQELIKFKKLFKYPYFLDTEGKLVDFYKDDVQ